METTLSTSNSLAVKQWSEKTFVEYLRQFTLAKYMGMDEFSMIQVIEDLKKQKGDQVTFGLIGGLKGTGVRGDATLEGNEEQLKTYPMAVTLDQVRNATMVGGRLSEQRYPFEIRTKAKPALLDWMKQTQEDDCFLALGSIDGVNYSAASEAQKDTWLANNSDRVLFGAATSNNSSNDHSSSLANVDTTNDKLSCAIISLAKRMGQLARPKIRPIKIENGMEFFVLFAHPYSVRDLKADSVWTAAQRDAMPRGMENPLFTGAVGYWDGVLVVESDRVPVLVDVGATSAEVSQNFLCGAQALCWANGLVDGNAIDFVEEKKDYGNKTGVAASAMYGVKKSRFETGTAGVSKDHGIVTVYVTAQAD